MYSLRRTLCGITYVGGTGNYIEAALCRDHLGRQTRRLESLVMQTADEVWMQRALDEAAAAEAAGEVPIGAVIVKDGELIASGQNRNLRDHDPTAHAEMVALRAAG